MERQLKLFIPDNFKEFGMKVNSHINEIKNTEANYLANFNLVRFNNGEGKAVLLESVRDNDVFILTDIGNYDITYDFQRGKNHMTPDEHYQDVKRIISAVGGHASRVSIIMPLLYQGRQDKRSGRESLDCAMALQELERLNVNELITFDAHNPAVVNAIPNRMSFSNGYATSDMILSLLNNEQVDIDKLYIVAPDNGARSKARLLADILGGVSFGNFDKRRDYTKVEDGKNPIDYHEFSGPSDLGGKDIIVCDDMIASGDSLLDTMYQLKERNANHIYLMTTYSLFTKGVSKFDYAYENGLFDKLYSTNLSYVPNEYKMRKWYQDVDCSNRIAHIICNLNEGLGIDSYLNGKNDTAMKIRSLKRTK